MKQLDMEELEKIGGGLIVEAKGKYFVVTDDGTQFSPCGYTNLEDAKESARSFELSTTVMSHSEFVAKFPGFDPWGIE